MPVSRASNFRVQSKDYFLTYPQCGFEKEALLEFLKEKWADPAHIIVSKELHEDGSPHLHAYAKYKSRKDVRTEYFFDFNGCHPNIQKPRNPAASKNYVKKDGDFCEFIVENESDMSGIFSKAKEMGRADFLVYCMEKKISHSYYREVLDLINDDGDTITITQPSELQYVMPEGLCSIDYRDIVDSKRSLVIVGPPGVGKTLYAINNSSKPALLVNHMDMLKHLKPHHKCIIFDDVDFKHIPVDMRKHLVDRYTPSQIHRRYGVTVIGPEVERIFTGNENPLYGESDERNHVDAIKRRTELVDLYQRETREDILRNSIQSREQ